MPPVHPYDPEMVEETDFGTRSSRGDWTPFEPLKTAPIFAMPFRVSEIFRWLPGYFLPWNAFYFCAALLCWWFLTPSNEVITSGSFWWVLAIYGRNALGILVFYSIFEVRLYLKRRQGTAFKYNARFPNDMKRKGFYFGNQTLDGMIRTMVHGVPIWTLYEAGVLWMFAKGFVLGVGPVWWLVVLGLVVPILHEGMFYLGHRLLHRPALYKRFHALHHKAINPSPWSSLAMHPVEHVVYFSTILLHLILASHPVLAMYQIFNAGYGAVVGHLGFDKIVLGDRRAMDTHAYAHYLHHKYFEVNYGDGLVPFDKLFGTWHDGSEAGRKAMEARRVT